MKVVFHIENSYGENVRCVKIEGINVDQVDDYRALVAKGLADGEFIADCKTFD